MRRPVRNASISFPGPWSTALALFCLVILFFSHRPRPPFKEHSGNCTPGRGNFSGYTFLLPETVNKNAAYAPYLVRWEDYYERFYFNRDIQKEDNVIEWLERFCEQAYPEHVELVVYHVTFNDLVNLRDYILAGDNQEPLPYPFGGNTFAEILVESKCLEVIEYLMFARKCEPYVVGDRYSYAPEVRDKAAMQVLIQEGVGRFDQTKSHYIRSRYAYQIVRLAHYSGSWQQTIDLYNQLNPKVDRKKSSIISFWTLGHLAGALRKLGHIPESSYQYALIFKDCPSKRATAFRSFYLRNDADWDASLRLCKNKSERATLYMMRAGMSKTFTIKDLAETYRVFPQNPQLELLLISTIQDLEKVMLATEVTEVKYGYTIPKSRRKQAGQQVISLQNLVRDIIKERRCHNLILWEACEGYLQILAGDHYSADKTLTAVYKKLKSRDPYHQDLKRQIDIWRVLLEIVRINPRDAFADQAGFRVRSYDTFQEFPYFEPFLQDWLSAAYAANGQPGKALLSAYPTEALTYNPDLEAIDDLLDAADESDPVFMERAMQMDTNPERLLAYLREIKGAALLADGQPEAAITVMQEISNVEQLNMKRFSPFREMVDEKIHRPVTDTLLLNRLQIAEKLLEFEFKARAEEALGLPTAARYYYLIGLGYYNMSYFGYEWEATDYFRSGANWNRLAKGPVFPLIGSPSGNRENLDLSLALSYFEKTLAAARDPELAARAAFMAARCQQKQWFSSPGCTYRPGNKNIPLLPEAYNGYYGLIKKNYKNTAFYKDAIQECKWLEAYTR